jgi:S-(hydroxymethyl)glutathione dehydrogenase/alcohol dehydrogenase
MTILPTKAKAAVLEKLGHPLAIRTIELPGLERGQVLVKVHFSGVCRSQVMEAKGGRGQDPWLPHLLGHEGSGEVLAIGEGVTKVEPGDKVIIGWIKSSGLEAPGAKYSCGGQIINSGRVTTFSNYTIVSENRIVKKPESLPMDVAILFGCALPTGCGMVLNELRPNLDMSVLVLGLGGIGLSALMALKALGLKQVIAADISDVKLSLAKKIGATHIINPTREDIGKRINELTNGGADVCIESGGSVESIELGFSLIRKGGGRLLFASHPTEGQKIRIAPHELISGKQITGSWGGSSMPDRDVPRIYEILKQAEIPLDCLITKRYTLEQINEAIDDLDTGNVFRPLIVMDHD